MGRVDKHLNKIVHKTDMSRYTNKLIKTKINKIKKEKQQKKGVFVRL